MFTGPLGLIVATAEVEDDPVAAFLDADVVAHPPVEHDPVGVDERLGLEAHRRANSAAPRAPCVR